MEHLRRWRCGKARLRQRDARTRITKVGQLSLTTVFLLKAVLWSELAKLLRVALTTSKSSTGHKADIGKTGSQTSIDKGLTQQLWSKVQKALSAKTSKL